MPSVSLDRGQRGMALGMFPRFAVATTMTTAVTATVGRLRLASFAPRAVEHCCL